jgi:hypothetical protein
MKIIKSTPAELRLDWSISDKFIVVLYCLTTQGYGRFTCFFGTWGRVVAAATRQHAKKYFAANAAEGY